MFLNGFRWYSIKPKSFPLLFRYQAITPININPHLISNARGTVSWPLLRRTRCYNQIMIRICLSSSLTTLHVITALRRRKYRSLRGGTVTQIMYCYFWSTTLIDWGLVLNSLCTYVLSMKVKTCRIFIV